MDNHGKANSGAVYTGAVFISFLIGIAFRIAHLFIIGFAVPFHLGGLFHQMSLEIIKNGFILPASIPFYSPGGLPFAYPPLPFTIQALAMTMFSPRNFFTVNTLPPFFSILSLFAFYFLARDVIEHKVGLIAAVFTFSIIPLAFSEQIEAMGLAESLGTLCLVLYLWALVNVFKHPQKSHWIIPGICLGLCILSSPGSLYASILISVLLLILSMKKLLVNKDARFFLGCFIAGITGLIVFFPYWYTVIARHGVAIFTDAFSAQNSSLLHQFVSRVLALQVIHASPFWNGLFIFGFLSAFLKKQYGLIFFTIGMLLIPREDWIMAISASLLIGVGVLYLLDLLQRVPKINHNLLKVAVIWALILFCVFDSYLAWLSLIQDKSYDISATQIQELAQVKTANLIPADQYVVVLGSWGLIEWSPALLERTVINNPFGLEWLPRRYEKIHHFFETLLQSMDPHAVMSAIRETFADIDQVILIASREHIKAFQDALGGETAAFKIIQEFEDLGVGLLTLKN